MIHTRERWQVRMHSGAVHVIDPLTFAAEAAASESSPFAGPVTKALNMVGAPYLVAYAYDRLDSIVAGDPVLLAVLHIESISVRSVQIEAGEDAFK